MDQRLLEQIDACRQGPRDLPLEDLRAPELADLSGAAVRGDETVLRAWSQIAAVDRAISAVLQDVPVPDDFSERLLMALKAAEQGEPADAVALQCQPQATRVPTHAGLARTEVARRAQPTRRAWLGWTMAAATVVAAACVALALFYPWRPAFVTQEEVAHAVA